MCMNGFACVCMRVRGVCVYVCMCACERAHAGKCPCVFRCRVGTVPSQGVPLFRRAVVSVVHIPSGIEAVD